MEMGASAPYPDTCVCSQNHCMTCDWFEDGAPLGLSVCESVSMCMAAPRAKSNNGPLCFPCQSHFLTHRKACLPLLIWGQCVCVCVYTKPYAHTNWLVSRSVHFSSLIEGSSRCIYSFGNWGSLVDGVCPVLWKQNFSPEFRRTVKLSRTACLVAENWPWWWNAKGQWHSLQKEVAFKKK